MFTKFEYKLNFYLIWEYVYKLFLTAFFCIVTIIATGTDYYVSNDGNDSNSGVNSSDAWRTLDKVNSFVPSPGDKILFKRGDEWVGTLIVKSSGTPNNPIVYGAYGNGDKPKISGSSGVTGWQHYRGNIYKAKVTALQINQIFIDYKRMNSARHPNSGYFKISQVNSPKSFNSPQISTQINYAGAIALMRTREWSISSLPVIYSSGKSLTITSAPLYDLNVDEGFVLFDKLEFLDQPGEWFFDVNDNTLYIWTPSGDSPESYDVRASVRKNAVFADKKNHIVIENLELLHFNDDAILLNNCRHLTIQNNDIIWPDSKGISLTSRESDNCIIKNNFINGANFEGIHLAGKSHIVSDNIIKNIHLFENFGVSGAGSPMGGRGIFVGHGENNLIKYNRLDSIGYNGIQMFDAPHTKIINNVIKNSCLTKEDGGGIYCYNTAEDKPGCEYSEIRGNIIDDVPGTGAGYSAKVRQGCGIYIDDQIHHITVKNNTVTNISSYGIYLHNTKHINVEHNTIFNAGSSYRATAKYNATGNTFKHNTIVNIAESNHSGSPPMLGVLHPADRNIIYIDENIYSDHHRTKPFKNVSNYSYVSFDEWKTITGHDKNSIFKGEELKEDKKEILVYNETKQARAIELGNLIYQDVLGNAVSGEIILEPFESVILFGKKLEKVNQAPVMNDQTFNIYSPTPANSNIAKVIAIDTEEDQQLFFSIAEGNQNDIFSINSSSGELYIEKSFGAGTKKTFQLKISVTDNAADPLTSSATVTINFNISKQDNSSDTEPPVITSFLIPNISSSLTVPIEQLNATDNHSVNGFFFSLTPGKPTLDHSNWLSSSLPRLQFSSPGEKTIYVWAKDNAGNISEPAVAVVNILLTEDAVILNDSTEYVSICKGDEFLGWSEAGEYKRTIHTSRDTIQEIITHLTVNSVKYETEGITIYDGENYEGWTESGIYQRTLTSSDGCDSIVTTNLSIISIEEITEYISICEGEEYLGWTQSGNYFREEVVDLYNIQHITTNLTVNPVQHTTEDITIYKGESYNGWTESGSYTHTYTSVLGCDSIVYSELSVQPLTGEPQYTYLEWSKQKRYRRSSEENSLDEADRLKSITKLTDETFIYPNPSESYIIIDFPSPPEIKIQIILFDNSGKFIENWWIESDINKICLRDLPAGPYFLKIKSSTDQTVKKIIKR